MVREIIKGLFRSRAVSAGFSLLEIMVVITIMAMIMGAVSVGVMSALERAKVKNAKNEIQSISQSLDMYKVDYGKYPDSLDALVKEKYMKEKKIPKDPWTNDYIYIYPGSNNSDSFDLYSFGKDGKEGGGDDITNWDEEE